MTDQQPDTTEDRANARQAAEDARRAALAEFHLDGPYPFDHGGGLTLGALLFGGSGIRDSFAVCLRCGAAVVLNDPEERPAGPPIERGVRLHTAWHEEVGR